MNKKNLAIYLNDHLAGSIAGLELAKRSAGANEGNEYGDYLTKLVIELEESQVSLVKLMEHLGIRKDLLKDAAAWMGEKVGRLKLNGQLMGYSDLSRVVEFEGLYLGLQGQLGLWRNLKTLQLPDIGTSGIDLAELESRAEILVAGVEEHRSKAAATAFN